MSTYSIDGSQAQLITAEADRGEHWNGFAVPYATADEVATYINAVVEHEGVAREDMDEVFEGLIYDENGLAMLDGITWDLVNA